MSSCPRCGGWGTIDTNSTVNAPCPDCQVVSIEREPHDCPECARLRAGLELLAQIRAVCGSAQGAFRCNLRIIDAVLAGADVRDQETVEAIAEGTWHP